MKLEVGKRYRTRSGKETTPLEKSDIPFYSFQAKADVIDRFWTEEGRWSNSVNNHPLDLVEEIEETKEEKIKHDFEFSEILFFSQDNLTTEQTPTLTFRKGTLIGNQLTVFSLNPEDYEMQKREDGTIILTPKKRKIWIEVYDWYGQVQVSYYRTEKELKEAIEEVKNIEEYKLLEVIEREYPNNKE